MTLDTKMMMNFIKIGTINDQIGDDVVFRMFVDRTKYTTHFTLFIRKYCAWRLKVNQ